MPELRQEPITEKWVIIATERSKRPSDFPVKHDAKREGTCPFCKGNEKLTPPEICSYREPHTRSNEPGWWIRVVPNKFPALTIDNQEQASRKGFYKTRPGDGAHEVIIESPSHDTSLDRQPLNQVEEIFRSWRERHDCLMKADSIKYVQIFKNEGAVAGASLQHPHSQLIAVPLIPDVINRELEGAQKFHRERGKCIYCEINRQELEREARVVARNEGFIAYCPFASRFPFETWVVPLQHQASFSAIDDSSLKQLSEIIKTTLSRITASLNYPPYNLILHTAPVGYQAVPYYHWHMEILPRLTIVAGFEWGTGIYINPTPPETAAGYLRTVKTDERRERVAR